MGNQQTRKRHAEEELNVVQTKKARLSSAGCSPRCGYRRRRFRVDKEDASPSAKKRRLSKFIQLPTIKFDSIFRAEIGNNWPVRDRCRSLDLIRQTSIGSDAGTASENLQSCTNIHRKEFPVPWLEALFLPEFPSRSAITEQNFLISNEIGYGSFGRVYRVVAKNDNRGIYALKIQQKSLILGKAAVQQVKQEVAVQYMSPDVAAEKSYSHYVDWWSLAVVLHILATGKYPYPNANATHHRHLRFVDYSTPPDCTQTLGDLFDQMLAFPPTTRLRSFEALRKHEFFVSTNFDEVEALKVNDNHGDAKGLLAAEAF
ncbi:hypothetical protein GCK32_008953 [Trichostrongylus colubriformis]|uniref:Protein kinase domain-containing protein n=1 Tax=Trichostrongylus colubriformis TaxID=6319 RepID=A0AAN8IU73_TRICO